MPIAKKMEDYTLPPPRPQRHVENAKWGREHIDELVQKYTDMWVAILDKEVVIASKDLEKVFRMAEQKENEVGRGPCVYKFIENFRRFRHPGGVSDSS